MVEKIPTVEEGVGSGGRRGPPKVTERFANERLTISEVDGILNLLMRDAMGNKADAAALSPSDVASALAYLKGILAFKKLGLYWAIADKELFDVAAASVVNTERWSGELYTGAAEDSDADINTTVSGKGYVIADPDATPVATGYWLRHKPERLSRFFTVIIDANFTWGSAAPASASDIFGGLMITKGNAYDANNHIYISRLKDTALDNITIDGAFGGAGLTAAVAAITDDAVAFKIERWNNIWRLYYSTEQYPDWDWTLVGQFEDTGNDMTTDVSISLFAYSPGDDDDNSIQMDPDNFYYFIGSAGVAQMIAEGYDSTQIAQDEDGSVMERLEYIQQNLIPDIGGLVFRGTCDAGMVGSTTTIVCGHLGGYGNDIFNTKYYMQVIKNANAVGTAPEPQVRQITDYVSATGTFTVTAFGANVEAGDEILVMHESLVLLGRDDADNAIATSNVRPNEDGSVLERQEQTFDWLRANGINGPYGNMFYVATTGNDANPGTYDEPFLTADYAVGQCTADNNDVIIVLPGAYDEDANVDGVQVDVAGITIMGANSPNDINRRTTFENSNGAATSVFNVTANHVLICCMAITESTPTVEGMITVANTNVRDIYFAGGMENGIRVTGASYIERCLFRFPTNDGIEITGPESVIKNCRFQECGDNGIHINHAGAVHNNIGACTVIGSGTTTTGINITAGDDNVVNDCAVQGCTNVFQDAGTNNLFPKNWRGSQITAGNTIEDDLRQIFDAASGNRDVGDVYYVATTGSDANPGTYGQPFLTQDYAVSQCTPNHNDVIMVMPGAYDEDANVDGVQVDVAGITIMGTAHDPNMDEVTVVNSNGAATSVYNVTVDNVRIMNLRIIETTATVEGIVTSGDNGVYEGIGFVGTMENGIAITGTYNTVQDCLFDCNTNDGIEDIGGLNVLKDNRFVNVVDNGINLNGAAGTAVLDNVIIGAGGTTNGINSSATGGDNIITGNKAGGCTNNFVRDASDYWTDNHEMAEILPTALEFQGKCDSGMAGSTTVIVSDDLAGYGNDFFNDKYYMQVVLNVNSVGNAPEREVQQITDYVSQTGTFTTNAFTVNVEANDEIIILHESQVAIGRNDADNVFDSSNVVANEDGSVLERQEHVQQVIRKGDDGSEIFADRSLIDYIRANGYDGPIGNIYVVASGGSDANSGSWDDPFASIDYAVGQCTGGRNDFILVGTASYNEAVNVGGVLVDVAGITIMGYREDATSQLVNVANSNVAATAVFTISAIGCRIIGIRILQAGAMDGIAITNADGNKILGCDFDVAMANGVTIDATSNDNEVKGCRFFDITNDGVEILGNTNTVRGCEFYACGDSGIHLNGDAADRNLIVDNTISGEGTTTTGINIALGDDNIIIDNKIENVTNYYLDTGTDNKFIYNHKESQISAGYFLEDDLLDINRYASLGVGPISKALTFNNDTGALNLFTVTGDIILKIIAVVTTDVTPSVAGVNVQVGIAADPNAILPLTLANGLDAREIWHDNSPDSEVESLDTARQNIITDGNDVIITLSAQVNTGVITFYCWWIPMSSGATVVPA